MCKRIQNIESHISKVTNRLKWKDIEFWCRIKNYNIVPTKGGYKVYIGSTFWSVHLEHRLSDELKFGSIRELRKILIKQKILSIVN